MSWLLKQFQPDNTSDIGETISRQFRNVADFLAPPPPSTTTTSEASSSSSESSQALVGIRNDLAEISDNFKNSLSLISGNKAVSEISKFASSFLQFGGDNDHDDEEEKEDGDDDEGVAGINDEVIEFVNRIAKRPELWTEFPLQLDHDFHMSDIQKEHVSAIENLVPDFAYLRTQLESSISDEQFWLIYFILLLPRLDEDDFELLLSTKIVETRDLLLQKLKNKETMQGGNAENVNVVNASQKDTEVSTRSGDPSHGKKKLSDGKTAEMDDEEAADKWLKEGDDGTAASRNVQKNLENEEDVSFSDLEDDDNDLSDRLSGFRHRRDSKASLSSESNEWVQLKGRSESQGGTEKTRQSISRDKDSSGEESSDWLAVDEFENS